MTTSPRFLVEMKIIFIASGAVSLTMKSLEKYFKSYRLSRALKFCVATSLNVAKTPEISQRNKITVNCFKRGVLNVSHLDRDVACYHEHTNQSYYGHPRQYSWVDGTLVDMIQVLESRVCSFCVD